RRRPSRARRRAQHRAPIALMHFSLAIRFEREYQLPFSFSPFHTMQRGEGLDAAVSRSTGRRWGGVVSSGGGRSRVNAWVGGVGRLFSSLWSALRGGSSGARRGSGGSRGGGLRASGSMGGAGW